MTIPAAALPGHHDNAPTIHLPHPGSERRLACPMCRSADDLVIDVPAVVHHAVQVYAVDVATRPEFEVTATTVPDEQDAPIDPVTKVRCVSCRWAFTGPEPLSKLVPAE